MLMWPVIKNILINKFFMPWHEVIMIIKIFSDQSILQIVVYCYIMQCFHKKVHLQSLEVEETIKNDPHNHQLVPFSPFPKASLNNLKIQYLTGRWWAL